MSIENTCGARYRFDAWNILEGDMDVGGPVTRQVLTDVVRSILVRSRESAMCSNSRCCSPRRYGPFSFSSRPRFLWSSVGFWLATCLVLAFTSGLFCSVSNTAGDNWKTSISTPSPSTCGWTRCSLARYISYQCHTSIMPLRK
jgi:hypothetical protein